MRVNLNIKQKKAQTAIEYLLLLTAVVAIVLIGFKQYLPRIQQTSNVYFNRVAVGIYGEPSRCGDGIRDTFENCCNCPTDANLCAPAGNLLVLCPTI